MSGRLHEFGADTEVVLVTFTDPEALAAYRNGRDLGFQILLDPDRVAYRAFGLGRGSMPRVWGRRALARYIELFRKARQEGRSLRLERPTEDTLQLGGDFVIARDGTLAWAFRGAGPDDRPSVDDLIAAVAAVA